MKFIVLLRGVNVGGRTIKMADLKACLEKAGFRNVITILQSGNVVIESKEANSGKLRDRIEELLTKTFDYPAKVMVIAPAALEDIIRQYPSSPDYGEEFHRYVIFTENGFEKELCREAHLLDKTIEATSPGRGVVYWRVLKGRTLDSDFGKQMNKSAAKHFITNRNLNTLEKIMARV